MTTETHAYDAERGSAQAQPAGPTTRSATRVHGIDGLRAVAALWVVLFHFGAFSGGALWPGIDLIVRSGSTGVSLFLVLSGLCLYLPFAGGRHSRFRTDQFFRRRIRRLLPAYYTTLVFLLAAHVIADGRWGLAPLGGSDLAIQTLTHATLTHQLFPETFYGINGAYWSLGLEWELYLTLPLLIFAAVRFGLRRTVATVFIATATYRLALFAAVQTGLLAPDGVWATVVLPNFFLGRWSEFALGMVAAHLYRTRGTQVGWKMVAAAVAAAAVAFAFPENPLNHMLYGIVFFTLTAVVLAGDNVVAHVFSWRPLVAVGVISYSLYLVHQPIVEVLGHLMGADQGADPRRVFLQMLLFLPLLLAVALALFVTVERRSLGPAGTPLVPVRQLLFPEGTRTLADLRGSVRPRANRDVGPSATTQVAEEVS